MVDITILEVNLSDSSFSARALFGDDEGEVDDEVNGDDESGDDDDGGNKLLATVAGLVVFAAVVAVLKFLLGGDDEEVDAEAPEEPVGVTIDDE